MSPRARQAKGKARLNAYEELLREDTAQKIETAEIYIAPGPRLGDIVVEARGLKKGYGDNLLIDDLELHAAARRHRRRDRPERRRQDDAVPNDYGPGDNRTRGTLKIGDTVQVGYVDQSRDALDPNKTVFEEITGGAG